MKLRASICALLVATQLSAPAPAFAATDNPSAYLQCDGNPNNMSAGEGIARFIGAVTLLAIFAPQRETPDDEARLFGEEGVAICNNIIDGDKAEGNVARRLPLITARAIHHIEALNYEAALADITKARLEARGAGLAGDIYYDRSFGQSLDRIEAAALVRLDRVDEAKQMLFKKAKKYPHSLFVVGATVDLAALSDEIPQEEIDWLSSLSKIQHTNHWVVSTRLQLAGRWKEAAELNDSYLTFTDGLGFEEMNSEFPANMAVVHKIAGNSERAKELFTLARSNLEGRRRRGKPEVNEATTVVLLDFYEILDLADAGDLTEARLRYGSRSEWVGISSAHKLHASRLLREGAKPEELRGALAKDEQAILASRREERMAEMLASDKDNKTLFSKILPYANPSHFEDISKRVWKVSKSKMLGEESPDAEGMFYIEGRNTLWQTRFDAMLLHSALLAKDRGKQGFNFWMESNRPIYGFVRFGDLGDPKISASQFLNADEVIAELREAIPPPAEVKARKEARRLERKRQKREAKNRKKNS